MSLARLVITAVRIEGRTKAEPPHALDRAALLDSVTRVMCFSLA